MTRAVIAAALAAGVCLAMIAQASAEWPADRPIRLNNRRGWNSSFRTPT